MINTPKGGTTVFPAVHSEDAEINAAILKEEQDAAAKLIADAAVEKVKAENGLTEIPIEDTIELSATKAVESVHAVNQEEKPPLTKAEMLYVKTQANIAERKIKRAQRDTAIKEKAAANKLKKEGKTIPEAHPSPEAAAEIAAKQKANDLVVPLTQPKTPFVRKVTFATLGGVALVLLMMFGMSIMISPLQKEVSSLRQDFQHQETVIDSMGSVIPRMQHHVDSLLEVTFRQESQLQEATSELAIVYNDNASLSSRLSIVTNKANSYSGRAIRAEAQLVARAQEFSVVTNIVDTLRSNIFAHQKKWNDINKWAREIQIVNVAGITILLEVDLDSLQVRPIRAAVNPDSRRAIDSK